MSTPFLSVMRGAAGRALAAVGSRTSSPPTTAGVAMVPRSA